MAEDTQAFHTQFVSIMEILLSAAVRETTKLYECGMLELRAEISRTQAENRTLKSRLSGTSQTPGDSRMTQGRHWNPNCQQPSTPELCSAARESGMSRRTEEERGEEEEEEVEEVEEDREVEEEREGEVLLIKQEGSDADELWVLCPLQPDRPQETHTQTEDRAGEAVGTLVKSEVDPSGPDVCKTEDEPESCPQPTESRPQPTEPRPQLPEATVETSPGVPREGSTASTGTRPPATRRSARNPRKHGPDAPAPAERKSPRPLPHAPREQQRARILTEHQYTHPSAERPAAPSRDAAGGESENRKRPGAAPAPPAAAPGEARGRRRKARPPAPPGPHRCADCGKSFGSQRALHGHSQVHQGERRHVCPHCGRGFHYQASLARHAQRAHGPARAGHPCPLCARRFSLKANLHTHLRTHSGEAPFRCGVCGEAFAARADMNAHLRSHSGERRHTCGHCGKRFQDLGNFNRHKRIHTGEKPYGCEVCGKTFTQTAHLKKHALTHR